MADAWMPGARCIRARSDGGDMAGGAPRVVWLTLGADPRAVSVWSAAQQLKQEGRPCHLVWDPLTGDIAQLLPIVRAGCALGTPEHLEWAPPEQLPHGTAAVNRVFTAVSNVSNSAPAVCIMPCASACASSVSLSAKAKSAGSKWNPASSNRDAWPA